MPTREADVIVRVLSPFKQEALASGRVFLRAPRLSDWKAWAELRHESMAHLVPWEPVWPKDSLSRSSFRNRLRRYGRDARDDTGHAFFLFQKEDQRLIGGITLSNIRRGVAQTGSIGYWTGLPFVRQGYMYEGLRLLLPSLFSNYGLRRIEAACLPENTPSAALLEKIGFQREGRARQYLCINGVWQDHLLYALLEGDPLGPSGVSNLAGKEPGVKAQL